jgi:hypothetical protein
LAAEADLIAERIPAGLGEAAKQDVVAPDVYFHEGDISDSADAVCNNSWIVFEDYVLVIDANFPAGAKLIISKIRALTDKPIRFASILITMGITPMGMRSSWRMAAFRSRTQE